MLSANKATDKRIIIIQVLIALWVMLIGYKLVKLQIGDHTWLRARAEREAMCDRLPGA